MLSLQNSNKYEFLNAVEFWNNKWSSRIIITLEALMDHVNNKYAKLHNVQTWGKQSAKDGQLIALTSQLKTVEDCYML
jgi:hypothetical protein